MEGLKEKIEKKRKEKKRKEKKKASFGQSA